MTDGVSIIVGRLKRLLGSGPGAEFSAGFFATLGFLVASGVWTWYWEPALPPASEGAEVSNVAELDCRRN